MTTPRRPGVRGHAPVPVRVTSHYQDALFARGQETITCASVASRVGQIEHEPTSAGRCCPETTLYTQNPERAKLKIQQVSL